MLQRRIENRLQELFEKASLTQYMHGLDWYAIAYTKAERLAERYELPLFKVIGVLAALSPNNKWERNLKDADLFLATPSLDTKVCTFKNQRIKALAILQADNEVHVEKILNGRKTISFFQNIMYHSTSRLVTVDLWMFRIAELPHKKQNYEVISKAVSNVSKKNSVLPHQLQAVVWTVVRPNK